MTSWYGWRLVWRAETRTPPRSACSGTATLFAFLAGIFQPKLYWMWTVVGVNVTLLGAAGVTVPLAKTTSPAHTWALPVWAAIVQRWTSRGLRRWSPA